jgi:hypothetical protein
MSIRELFYVRPGVFLTTPAIDPTKTDIIQFVAKKARRFILSMQQL